MKLLWKVVFLYFFFNICFGHSQNKPLKSTSKKSDKSCGHQNVTILSRIYGGETAEIGEFPWMARLYYKKKRTKNFGCSGFLISQKVVLTAAHCLDLKIVKDYGPIFEVQLGEHDTRTVIDCDSTNKTCADKVQIIRVKKAITHPSYKMRSRHVHNDIGLLFLKKNAKISKYVSPICLEKHDSAPIEYWLSGWGETQNASQSDVKMKVSVPPFSHSNCTKLYKKVFNQAIKNTQICAGGQENKDSCKGDSGGPLMVVHDGKWFAAGIVSYGYDCGKKEQPAIYTNVTSYFDWIKNTTQSFGINKIKTASKN